MVADRSCESMLVSITARVRRAAWEEGQDVRLLVRAVAGRERRQGPRGDVQQLQEQAAVRVGCAQDRPARGRLDRLGRSEEAVNGAQVQLKAAQLFEDSAYGYWNVKT
jgi:hypothetical protein